MLHTQNIRRKQLSAWAIIIPPLVLSVCYNLAEMLGVRDFFISTTEALLAYSLGVRLITVCCTFSAFWLMSKNASNVATSKFMKFFAIAICSLDLLRVVYYYCIVPIMREQAVVSNVAYSLPLLMIFLLGVVVNLYFLGGMERNNPDQPLLKRVLQMWLIVMVLEAGLVPLYVYAGLQNAANIISSLLYVVIYYKLFTNPIFSGIMDTTPAPKGTYKFWNSYFNFFLITYFGMAILSSVLAVLISK